MTGGPDLSEFVRLSRPRKKACSVGAALAALEDGARAQLEAALATDVGIITGGAIEKWLAAREQKVTSAAVSSHRRRACSCADAHT